MAYEELIKRIIDASQSKTLTFFVGAGVSKLSGAPSWSELTDEICDKLGRDKEEKYTSDSFLQIPQMYYDSLGKNKKDYYETIQSIINIKNLSPNSVHREMLSLNPVSFVTTNYDTLLEDAAAKYCQMFKVISQDKDVPSIAGDRFILKIHGDFTNNNFVLKEEDYLNYSENFKLIETILKAIFSTNTVVFIGYGLGDYNIKLILNWVKKLLKGNFRNPIFLYTDSNELKECELKYNESKGLSVFEYQKIGKLCDSFEDRYLSFFNEIKKNSVFDITGKDSYGAFKTLYLLLKPLNELKALRYEDVSKVLFVFGRTNVSDGTVILSPNKSILFEKFIELDRTNPSETVKIEKDTLLMFSTIKDVLGKANIHFIYYKKSYYRINHSELSFMDSNCILFNYRKMNAYVNKQYKKLECNYKKAFYLYKLYRYDEALRLFIDVSKKAFNDNNYLLFYFANINIFSMKRNIQCSNGLYADFDISDIYEDISDEKHILDLFNKLPFDFRNKYESLKDIYSSVLLYKCAYDLYESADKIHDVVNKHIMEYGVTSIDKATKRINDYMNFIQSNGLVVDRYAEYENALKKIMEAFIRKYSVQDKRKLLTEYFFPDNQERIEFDEVHFNNFIECFKAEEIIKIIDNYSISTLKFKDINKIESAVNNLINYYESVDKEDNNGFELINIQLKIKNAIAILAFTDISQALVNRICSFILNNEFIEILIDDKIRFLYYQVYLRMKNSQVIRKTVEKQLLSYIDMHKKSLESNTKFGMPSKQSNITYCNLAEYLFNDEKDFLSKGLSDRVDLMIKNDQIQLFSPFYYNHVSKSKKKKILSWISEKLNKTFDFESFALLVNCDCSISQNIVDQLILYLREKIAKGKNYVSVVEDPKKKRYEKLVQVGIWCLFEKFDSEGFNEFLGFSNEFDFYYLYDKFDYNKFDVSWLLLLNDTILRKIASNKNVVTKIRKKISQAVKSKELSEIDNTKLLEILVNYFC